MRSENGMYCKVEKTADEAAVILAFSREVLCQDRGFWQRFEMDMSRMLVTSCAAELTRSAW
jgi:hypothetical protein